MTWNVQKIQTVGELLAKICSERFCWILLEKNLVMRCSCVKTSTGWHKLARTLNLGPEVNQNMKKARMELPSENAEAVGFEGFRWKGLGEEVSVLEGCVEFADGGGVGTGSILGDMLPEPMPLVEIPTGTGSDAMVGGEVVGTLVVFERTGRDG